MFKTIRTAGLCLALALPAPLHAMNLDAPSGRVVLSVTGSVAEVNAEGTVQFDLDMLEALPQHSTETETPWHEGTPVFTGPRLSTILDAVGGDASLMRVYALNDYSAEIPVEEVRKYPVILATRMDGKRLPVRDKGPLFVIYPFSDAPELFNELTFNRSVWQVSRIEIE